MSTLGLGVMLGMLGGNADSVEAFSAGVGQKITRLWLDEAKDCLRFEFENGYKMSLADEGQSCCETRYITTDDDLSAFVGATLLGAEVRAGSEADEDYGVHEIQFLVVKTSLGEFTCETHNEHNGYCGGFLVRARKDE